MIALTDQRCASTSDFPELPRHPAPVFSTAQDRRRQLLDAWLSGRTETTKRAYAGDAAHFAAWFGHEDTNQAIERLFSLDAGEGNHAVLCYKQWMAEKGLSAATIGRRLAALRSLSKLANVLGVASWTVGIESPPAQAYRDVSGPGRVGWARMREAAELDVTDRGIRDRAILELAYTLGLRRNEIVTLDLEHIEFEDGLPVAAWILGKGRTAREKVTIPGPTGMALAAWLERRGDRPGALIHRLDRAWTGQPERLTGQSIADICERISKAAMLARTCRPHMIRHRSVSDAARLFPDVEDVMAFARHRSYSTTRKYIDAEGDRGGKVAARLAGG